MLHFKIYADTHYLPMQSLLLVDPAVSVVFPEGQSLHSVSALPL